LPNHSVERCDLPEPSAVRAAHFGRRAVPTPIFHRELLSPGMHGKGPALIVSGQSTTVIPPHYGFSIDGAGTLVATRMQAQTTKSRRQQEQVSVG
jgi:5-oxoprolinase (ATP-hydrolysing)